MDKFLTPIGLRLAYSFKRYVAVLDEKMSALDIERYFYAVWLLGKPDYEGVCQQDLANLLQVDKASLVRVLDYLSQHGYLTRNPDPADRRRYRLVLTDKGRAMLPLIEAAYNQSDAKAMEGFTPEERLQFSDLLARVEKNLESESAHTFYLTFAHSRPRS